MYGIYRLIRIGEYSYTYKRTRVHVRAPTCASRSMTVHGNLLIHSVARDRRCLVADEISSSLRTPLPSPSAFTTRAHYEIYYTDTDTTVYMIERVRSNARYNYE